jgi:hypothetical protein
MSPEPSIYAVRGGGGAAELQRVLRVLLAGSRMPVLGARTSGKGFLEVRGPHALQVVEAGRRGAVETVAELDGRLPPCVRSCRAGAAVLAARTGARHLPVLRRYGEAVREGRAPGHWVSVMALHAVEFSVGMLPLLQCLLYAEWRQSDCGDGGVESFLRESAGSLSALPALLRPDDHENRGPVPFRG